MSGIEYILKEDESKLTVDLLEEIMPWSEELPKIHTKTKACINVHNNKNKCIFFIMKLPVYFYSMLINSM